MFIEAILPAMRKGRRARHLDWPEDKYLYVENGNFAFNDTAITAVRADKKSTMDLNCLLWLSEGWELVPEPEKAPDEEPTYTKSIPVTVYGFSNPDIPEETRNHNIERANKAVELMDSASRQIVQDVCDLVARAAGSDLAEALEKVMLDTDDATGLARSLEFWVRKHKAAGAELHGACSNRPTHPATQKILDEQLE